MNTNKKSHLLMFTRIGVQIIFLIILPGLYASVFRNIRIIYGGILNNNLSTLNLSQSLVEIIAIIPITIILGRFFCGWMCTFGAVSDWLYIASRKIFKFKSKVPKNVEQFLKYIKYVVLILIVTVLWNQNTTIKSERNPWNAFGYIFTVKNIPDIGGAITNVAIGTILLLIILGFSFFIERFFCRYLCPLGAIFTVLSRIRIFKIKKDSTNCGNCKLCTDKCSMGLPLGDMETVVTGECIQCMKCTVGCPQKSAILTVANKKINILVATAIAILGILSIYYGGKILIGNNKKTVVDNPVESKAKYIDGTYEGSGIGFREGPTTVSVTISGDKITDIAIVSYSDDKPYFSRAYNTIISEILSSQSTGVDVVSGATYSSDGIIAAVQDALDKATN